MDIGKKLSTFFDGFKGEDKKRTNLIMLLAGVAILLIAISDLPLFSCAERTDIAQQSSTDDAYAEKLEQKLCSIISSIEGAGEVKVMVTLRNGAEYIYASEDKSSINTSASQDTSGRHSTDEKENSESSFIIIETENGEEALVQTELMPTVSGVVVVCSGADDPQVAARIREVVTTVLNISSKRVCITKLSE